MSRQRAPLWIRAFAATLVAALLGCAGGAPDPPDETARVDAVDRTTVPAVDPSDQAALRRSLGLVAGNEAPHRTFALAMNAVPTDDPAVFVIPRTMEPEGLGVALSPEHDPRAVTWLQAGESYVHDPATAQIHLLGGVVVDSATESLVVLGTPVDDAVIHLRPGLDRESVIVIVDDRRLQEGEGFRVDYAAGDVTILDAAFRAPDARYFVSAKFGGNTGIGFGNYEDSERLGALLRN